MRTDDGFTLIELLIVVAIIGVLAAIAVPQFSQLIRKSREGSTKGNLGAIRSALAIYYANTEGQRPTDDLSSLITLGYLNTMPKSDTVIWHPAGNHVGTGDYASLVASSGDTDNWWYYNQISDPQFGQIYVNCIHTDTRGAIWTTY